MKQDAPLKVRVTLDEDVAEEIKELSGDAYRSFSQYINLILRKHTEKLKKYKDSQS